MGKGLLFRSAMPSTQVGMVPADPYCEGSPAYVYTVWPTVTKFDVVKHMGMCYDQSINQSVYSEMVAKWLNS